MRAILRSWAVCAATATLTGCATVRPQDDYQRASRTISEATGATATTQPDSAASEAFDPAAMLGDGLTVDEAVQLCLLNNPGLLAAFYDIGIARADLVQSTLFSNPTLAMSIAFPDGGGLSNIQATFAQSIVDLWQIPVRKQSAERSLDAAILNVAHRAVNLTIGTKTAYFTCVAADQTLRIAEENRGLTAQLLQVAEARQKAGAVGELDVNLAKGTVFGAELDVQRARLEARSSRRRLGIALGLTQPVEELLLTTPLTPDSPAQLNAEEIEKLALADRPDIRAARESVNGSLARVRLEYLKVFPDFAIGFYDERNESRSQERENILGPAFNLTLPIFDQNQAQIAKARLAYAQAVAELDALERAVVQLVREAVDQVRTTSSVSSYFRGKLLPQAKSNLELSQRSYEVGRASVIMLLNAQRILLSSRRDAISADRDRSVAIAELERVTARPYSAIVAIATSRPAPTPGAEGG